MTPSDAITFECGNIVRDAVAMHRDRSVKEAQGYAAHFLSISVRRVRSYWNGEVKSVPAVEAFALLAKRRDVIVARQQRLDEELHSLQLRLAALDAE